eukprot:338874_1
MDTVQMMAQEGAINAYAAGFDFWKTGKQLFPEISSAALIWIPLFSIWRFIFEKWVIDSTADKFAAREMLKKGNKKSFETNKQKFKEQYWKALTTLMLMCYGQYSLYHSPFFWDTSLLFKILPHPMPYA